MLNITALALICERGYVMAARYLRLFANAIITMVCILLIAPTVMAFSTTSYHWLWAIPAVLVTSLDLYFLTKSTLKTPQNMDTRVSTFLISLSGALTFSFSAVAANYPLLELPYIDVIQTIGRTARSCHIPSLLPLFFLCEIA